MCCESVMFSGVRVIKINVVFFIKVLKLNIKFYIIVLLISKEFI